MTEDEMRRQAIMRFNSGENPKSIQKTTVKMFGLGPSRKAHVS